MMRTFSRTASIAVLISIFAASVAVAADWPMWRGDAMRSAATTDQLPDEMHLQWSWELPALSPAWPDEPRMRFDVAYEPVAAGDTVFVASPRADKIMALDARTGEAQWTFYADGPVRFAPVIWQGAVYFGSDDGHLYCVGAADGKLRWKFLAGPSERRVLGNARLISAWPMRGAPVISDGVVYCAAGIWPFMGIFVYALDANSGQVIWVNDGQGAEYTDQPHGGALAFGSVAPQGYMVLSGDRLIVPSGRSTPAVFDKNTGAMLYYRLAENKYAGNFAVAATSGLFFNSGQVYPLDTGTPPGKIGANPVVTEDAIYTATSDKLTAWDPGSAAVEEGKDSRGRSYKRLQLPALWSADQNADRVWLKAADTLVVSDSEAITGLRLADGAAPTPAWSLDVEGDVASVIAAGGRLIVSTLDGHVLCYGGEQVEAKTHPATATPPPTSPGFVRAAADILAKTGASDGYCLCLGEASSNLVEALASQSQLRVIGVIANAKKAAVLRRRLDEAGLYGDRAALLVGDPANVMLPPYMANLMVTETPKAFDAKSLARDFASLRPYGGVACLPAKFAAQAKAVNLPGAEVERAGKLTLLRRAGALPGAGSWTHQYADAANTVVSKDSLVRAPLGLLWFGGSSNTSILPRHGHGPPEQIIGGRLFIEGPNSIRAQDVYTGRPLWQRDLPGFGKAYDNTSHQPGANALGSNYSSAADAVYAAYGDRCLVLDPATGETTAEFTLPPAAGEDKPQAWGFLSVYEDLLIAGASPIIFDGELPVGVKDNWDATSSAQIVALDRHSGEVLWTLSSKLAFRHNAICIADGRLFCIDRLPDAIVAKLARRGDENEPPARLLALDAHTGEQLWTATEGVFGTWLSSSEKNGLLLQAGRPSRDMLSGEPSDHMTMYHVADGSIAWDKSFKYQGPPLLHGDTIFTQTHAFNMLTGEPLMRTNPITGAESPWTLKRMYGCNTIIASKYLLTFRSGAAGFCDLAGDGGTGNLGGFKSGCTSNLIVADGVLNAPDYTRTCTCSYQNQTSLALIHMPEVELWTFSSLALGDAPIRRLGLNLGAPGDRRAPSGTVWLDYPSSGGPSPDPEVTTVPARPTLFRRHSSRISGDELRWVGASGAVDLREIAVRLVPEGTAARSYTVNLYFAEPDDLAPGQRVFDVAVQGNAALSGFDIVREAGAPRTVISRSVADVSVTDLLTVKLAPAAGSEHPPVLCGIEAIAQ